MTSRRTSVSVLSFGVDPSTDFRFTYGQNHGLGYVHIMYSDGPFAHKKWQYPPADLSNTSSQRLVGDSGATTNNTIAFIRNDQGADKQFEHFVPAQTSGLTLNGLGRINQSIMAFGYCILGSQANTRSSILGNLGTARNTQTDFLVLIEDSIKTLKRIEWASEVSRRYRSDQGEVELGRRPGCATLARSHDHQHGEHCGLQQQSPPGNG